MSQRQKKAKWIVAKPAPRAKSKAPRAKKAR